MLTKPLYRPRARYCPSLVQLHAVTLLLTLCLDTDFCSGDHNPLEKKEKTNLNTSNHNLITKQGLPETVLDGVI